MKHKINPNDPAMPHPNHEGMSGLSIREELAARAMQGIIASWPTDAAINHEEIAEESVLMADALIEELNKDEKVL